MNNKDWNKNVTIPSFYDNKIAMEGHVECPDPFVLRFDGKYYLYFTKGGRKLYAYCSTDLLHYEPVDNHILEKGVIYDYDQDSNHPESETPFAPEVCYYDGMFYMVASPSGNGHYIFSSSSPCGPFKCISKNLERKIDGSFFIDSDEKIYLYAAFDDALKVYSVSNDFKTIGKEETFLSSCRLGRWNEGPYMLKRYGKYYLTYCGAHFLSTDYRVDYATVKDGSDLLCPLFYTRQDTILISTRKEFYGLGHSCTVLGPDLDSYFIIYHNLLDNRERYYNLSRLSFYSDRLAVNGARENDIPFVEKAKTAKDVDMLVEEKGAYVLDQFSDETFSVEFNNVGQGRMLFSFIDDNHYGFIDFLGDKIIIGKKCFEEEIIKEITLKRKYRDDVLHSYLLQYRKGYIAFYFDHMEKLYAYPASFEPGKVGYLINNRFERISSTSLSRFALGSSEEEYYKDHILLANCYDSRLSKSVSPMSPYIHIREGKEATYRIYVPEDGEYQICATLKKGYAFKQFSIGLSNGLLYPIYLEEESGNDEDRVLLTTIPLKKGSQTLSLIGQDDIYFASIDFEKVKEAEPVEFNFKEDFNKEKFFFRNEMKKVPDGLRTGDETSSGFIFDHPYSKVQASLSLIPEEIEKGGSLSLLFNASEFCNNFVEDGDGKDNPYSFRGYELSITENKLILRKVDFNYTRDIFTYSYQYASGEEITLSLKMIGNEITSYLNGNEIFSLYVDKGNFHGSIGFLAYKAKATLTKLLLEKTRTHLF